MVEILPGRAAIIRLAGAVLMDQNGEWAESRRYTGPDILVKVDALTSPEDTTTTTTRR